jgi:hypothetical protein
MNDYLYRAIFDIGDCKQDPLLDIHGYLFAGLFRSRLFFFQTRNFPYRYHSFSRSEACGHESESYQPRLIIENNNISLGYLFFSY